MSIQYENDCAKIFLVAYFNSDIVVVDIDDVKLCKLKNNYCSETSLRSTLMIAIIHHVLKYNLSTFEVFYFGAFQKTAALLEKNILNWLNNFECTNS